MDRATKLRKLNNFRRRLPHCTAAALAAILLAVQQSGLPDGGTSRDNYREARDMQAADATPYGPILQHIKLCASGDVHKSVPVAHPFPMLWTAINDCLPFKQFMLRRLREKPSSPEKPWNIIMYSDEVTPGNPLATLNKRKFQAVYWSFLEFGGQALSREESWICVMCEFSTTINKMQAGLSQAIGEIIKLFFDEDGFNMRGAGISLPFDAENIRFWAKLGGMIQDGGAHKTVWHSRGDGSSRPCLLCKNLVDYTSKICDEDGTRLLICNAIKLADLVAATSLDLRKNARFLASKAATTKGDAWTELQQSLGITHHPRSILLDESLDMILDPVKIYVHDWMHCIFVDGVCNLVVFLLFEEFIQKGFPIYDVFSEFANNWKWPSRVSGAVLYEIITEDRKDKHRSAKHIKCQASDLLSLVPVLAFFTHSVLMRLPDAQDLKSHCEAFLALVNVIEIIMATGRTKVHPQTLLTAVETFLSLFSIAFGFECMIPKFHWLLHLSQQLIWLGMLLNCFCLERKHRGPKRYATEHTNMSRKASESLLKEVVCHHLGQLMKQDAFAFDVGLVNGKVPSTRVLKILKDRLELDEGHEVRVSIESRFSPVATCREKDVIIFRDGGGFKAGTVLMHFEIDDIPLTMVHEFDALSRDSARGNSVWKPKSGESYKVIETCDILDTVVYSKLPDDSINILLPMEYR